jgi:carotenoid cleavage dioxygenase-like enzyme
VPRARARSEDDGWVLVCLYDTARADQATMALEILDGLDLAAGPAASIALPDTVPPDLHGSWSARYMGALPDEVLPYVNDIRVQR